MQKRTNGYILLILLVATGLAGRQYSATISSPERRLLIDGLKASKNGCLKSVEDLSAQQLDFRPAPGSCSVRDYLQHLTAVETAYQQIAAASLQRAEAEQALEEKLAPFFKGSCCSGNAVCAPKPAPPKVAPSVTGAVAAADFKQKRKDLIKYVRTATGNMHGQTIATGQGSLDAYQVLLLLPRHTEKCLQQIEALKAHPAFPKK